MLPLIGTVFIASLFGSLHCVGMCGPLAMLASSSVSPRLRQQRHVHVPAVVAYHGSRVVAYALAGAIAGLLGAGIQETGTLLGLQRLAARLAGGSMLVIGLLGIVRLASGSSHAALLPQWLQKKLAAGHAWARQQSPLVRASSIGLLTAILPCGWLFAFLIVAAGTAHAWEGALVMAVFALGSVPALAGLALSMTLVVGRFRRAIPWCSAVLITMVGALTLLERSQVHLEPMMAQAPISRRALAPVPVSRRALAPVAETTSVSRQPQAVIDPTSPDPHATLIKQIDTIQHAKLPCCEAAEKRAAENQALLQPSVAP